MRPRYVLLVICFIVLAVLNSAYYLANAADQSSLLRLKSDANDAALQGLPVKVKVKIYLQGCYDINTGQMTTLLSAGGYLPLTSPYCEDQRTVSAIPINVTDWVLVQLHNTADGAPVASHSSFLRQDGYIVADDGTTSILVVAPPGNYFITIVHRNHLTLMSASTISLNSNTASVYDFTTGPNKGYGINGMTELEPGIWGMWAGDINHDGLVTTRDYKIWFESERAGSAGYLHSDVNLDGLIDEHDYSIVLDNAKRGASSPIRTIGDDAEICLSVNPLEFGAVAVDGTVERIISITNTGTAELIVSNMSTSDADFMIVGITSFNIVPGGYQDVKIRFSPTMATIYNASLWISNNSVESVKEVSLNGEGFSAITDIDGNIYRIVKICDQWWMAENLKVKHYRNEDIINNTLVRNNDEANAAIYGRLYDLNAALDNRNLAPLGWHVPNDAEWQNLADCLGGNDIAGGKMKATGTNIEGTGLWPSPNTGATNESGFNAIGGYYHVFYDTRRAMYHSSSSSVEGDNLIGWVLNYENTSFIRIDYPNSTMLQVRCVKGENPFVNTMPIPSLTITPVSGPTSTEFVFDASACSDSYTPTSDLQVRWDWDCDDIWDTGYSTIKIVTHQYVTEGLKTIRMEVKDSGNLINSICNNVYVGTGVGEIGSVTDIEGNTYKTIKIGSQWWMTENLKVTQYRNGDVIDNEPDNDLWASLTTGAYCNYNNDESIALTYGRLYNWYAVNDPRGLAPAGWHVPTDSEWQTLIDFLGGDNVAGGKMNEGGYEHWSYPNTSSNKSGFTALPGGARGAYVNYYNIGSLAQFWSSTEISSDRAWSRYILNGGVTFSHDEYAARDKLSGFSVRCVMDN